MQRKSLLILIIGMLSMPVLVAQQLFVAKSSEVKFFSDAPLEDIEAVNTASQSLINTSTKEIAVKVPIKSFKFPNALMQEHFNENYMESEKYPQATFKGTINETINFTQPGSYPVTATGKLTIHGVERDQILRGKLQIEDGKMNLETSFEVLLADYKIKIPEIAFMKIAEKIAVSTRFFYQPYQKKAQ